MKHRYLSRSFVAAMLWFYLSLLTALVHNDRAANHRPKASLTYSFPYHLKNTESAATFLLGFEGSNTAEAWISLVSVVCFQVEVCASG